MRRRIALQKHFPHTGGQAVRKSRQRSLGFAELSECALPARLYAGVLVSLFAHRGSYQVRSLLPRQITAREFALLLKE
jgi:hypothetical protein